MSASQDTLNPEDREEAWMGPRLGRHLSGFCAKFEPDTGDSIWQASLPGRAFGMVSALSLPNRAPQSLPNGGRGRAGPTYIETMDTLNETRAPASFEDILADFELLDDWEDRYRYVIELGRKLEPLPDNPSARRPTRFRAASARSGSPPISIAAAARRASPSSATAMPISCADSSPSCSRSIRAGPADDIATSTPHSNSRSCT